MSWEQSAQEDWKKLRRTDKLIFWSIFLATCIIGIPYIFLMIAVRLIGKIIRN